MLLSLFQLALAADAPALEASKVEPVLEEARRDVKALRVARTAQVLMIALPGAMVASSFVVARRSLGPEQQALGVNGLLLSGIGMAVLANILQKKAIVSRKALVAQGLRVPRTPPVVVPVLSFLGAVSTTSVLATVVFEAASADSAADSPVVQGLLTGSAAAAAVGFGACFGLSTLQLEWNRAARKRAGWITVIPTRIDRTNGLALAGSW